jgi:hypothetical protein
VGSNPTGGTVKYEIAVLKTIVESSNSYAEVIRKLGLKQAGGTQEYVKKMIAELQISTAHFTGMRWNTGKEFKPFEQLQAKQAIRRRLIKERGRRCEKCTNSEWLGSPITVEVHHRDGDKRNNNRTNLALFCPNCHSITGSWRRRKTSSDVCPRSPIG